MISTRQHRLHVGLHLGLFALVALIFWLIRSMPLISTPSFEAANFWCAIFGPLCAFVAIYSPNKTRFDFGKKFKYEFLWFLGLIAWLTILLIFNSTQRMSCSPGAGLVNFFVTLTPTLLLNILLASIIITCFIKILTRFLVLFLFYLFYFGIIFFVWWQAPQFRILTHLSIIIPSDLVAGATLTPALYGFCLATFIYCLAWGLLGYTFFNRSRSNYLSPAKNNFSQVIFIILLFSLGYILSYQTKQNIIHFKQELEKSYNLSAKSHNLIIYADPLKISQEEIKNITHEANFYLKKFTAIFGPLSPKPITIWLHANDNDKYFYTGAYNVHFALPRHREIHISASTTPHPVLGHELAHIITGEFSSNIFGLLSKYYIFPNMGLSEGLAVYLSSELNISEDLDLMTKAQALYQNKVKPDIKRLFSANPLNFSQINPHASYIFAGAFLNFVLGPPSSNIGEKIINLISQGDIRNYYKFINNFYEYLGKPISPRAQQWVLKHDQAFSILSQNCINKTSANKINQNNIKISLLNNNITNFFKLVQKSSKQVNYLHMGQKDQLRKNNFDKACLVGQKLLAQADLSPSQIEKTIYLQLACLINLENYQESQILLSRINFNSQSPSQKRKFLILESILLELENNKANNTHKLYDSALKYLLSREYNFVATKNRFLVHNLLQSPTKESPQALLFCSYLYARALMHDKKYEKSLLRLVQLLNTPQKFSQIFITEMYLMLAHLHEKLDQAKLTEEIYTYLLKSPLDLAQEQIIKKRLGHTRERRNSQIIKINIAK